MKRIIKYFLFIIIIFLPYVVSANAVSSKMTDIDVLLEKMSVGKLDIFNVALNKLGRLPASDKPGVLISFSVTNNYDREIDMVVTLSFYDKQKNLLKDVKYDVNINSLSQSTSRFEIQASDLGTSLSNIGYYVVSCDNISDVKILDSKITEDYYVENFNLVVNVLDNNIYEIEESYDTKFTKYAKPVEKLIPIRHRYISNNDKNINRRAVITDIKLNDYYYDEIVKGDKHLVIGKANKFSDVRTVKLEYKYNVGKDVLKDNDEFVFYLLYNNDAQYDGGKFKIIMPRNITDETIEFVDSEGKKLKEVIYKVDKNIITGEFTKVINPGSKYAIRILLDDNYFKEASSNITSLTINSFVLSIIGLVFVILVYLIQKDSKKKVTYDKMYLTDKINSLEVGYLYHGVIKNNDIASLLFCLANKGYIEIVNNKRGYKIVKKKEYEEEDILEKSFMQELFFDKDEVTRKELMIALKDTSDLIHEKLSNGKRKKRLFIKEVLNYKLLFWIIITIIAIINVINILEEYQPSVLPINLVLTVVGYVVILRSLFSKNKLIEKVLYSLLALIMIVSPIVLSSYMAFFEDSLKLVAYIFGIVCMLIIACVASALNDRTRYGTKMLNRIDAYRNFLLKTNESTIINELQLNKNCLYDVLPYALVLGISDKWVDKFKNRDIEKPEWYNSKEFELYEWYEDIKYIYSDVYIALKGNKRSNE